jgi:hypothetical protein
MVPFAVEKVPVVDLVALVDQGQIDDLRRRLGHAEAEVAVRARRFRSQERAMRPDVTFQVILLKGGDYLAAPTVLGEFGQEVRIEVPDTMRAVVLAMEPDAEGRSITSAKMSIFQDGAWQPAKEMEMEAHLSWTPSFEYSVEGTPYRFVVMPRRIVPAASESDP